MSNSILCNITKVLWNVAKALYNITNTNQINPACVVFVFS